jgi:iron complex transport system substrate-binding protein
MARIVSLLPSATEIVCALGAESELVGISHECDFPPSIRNRRVLTRSRIDPNASSHAIDAAVRDVLTNALSIYAIDDSALAELAPDVIVTQDLCEVCAVSLDDVRAAVARLSHRDHVEIVSLSPTRLAHVLADIERVAAVLGRPERGTAVRRGLQDRIDAIAERAATAATRPRVVSIEWLEPLMLGGMWMPELIELAAGRAAGVSPGAPAPTLHPADLRALEADVIVLKPCGYTLEHALTERTLIERDILAHAGRARVYLTDGNEFFNRPGPRLVESLEIMAACVHPSLFGDVATKHNADVLQLR